MESGLAIFFKCSSYDLAFLKVFPKNTININRKMIITANFRISKQPKYPIMGIYYIKYGNGIFIQRNTTIY